LIDYTWYIHTPGIPEEVTAGGVIVRFQDNRILVALVRETEDSQYILPKGKVEPGEDLLTTARREILEESGLSDLTYLGELEIQERLSYNKDAWKIIHYYLFYTDQKASKPTDSNRLYTCEWFPIHQLPDMFWPEQEKLIVSNLDKITAIANQHKSRIKSS